MRKRQWKKILSVVLALAMVFSMNTAVFADEVTDPVAVEEPAAEAPVAETPVESEPEVPEEVTNEEPAAEAPAAEAEEPAAAEEAAEAEAPAAEAPAAEEPAGEDYNWQGRDSQAGFNVDVINSDSSISSAGIQIAVSSDVYIISVNKTEASQKILVTAKGDGASITKILVSGDSAEDVNHITGLVLSGNKISYDDEKIYKENDESELSSSIVMAAGHLALKDNTFGAYATGAVVYVNNGAKMKVSQNGYTVSFDKAVQEIYYDYNTTKYLASGNFAAQADIDIFENYASGGQTNLYVKLADDSYGEVTGETTIPARNAGIAVTTATATSASEASITLASAGKYVVKEGNVEVDYKALAAETGWKTPDTATFTVSNLKAGTTYTVITKDDSTASDMTEYKSATFVTKAEEIEGTWTESKTWYAIQSGTKTVSVNENAEGVLSINNADGSAITLVASDNAAPAFVKEVRLANAGNAAVTLSANKTGISINGVKVFQSSGEPAADLKAKSGSVIVGADGKYNCDVSNSLELKVGDTVYLADTLNLEKDFKVDYDKITMALSDNAATLVSTKQGIAASVEFAKNDPVDVTLFVASANLIFNFEPAKDGYVYGVLSSVPGWEVGPTPKSTVTDYGTDYFVIKNTNDVKDTVRYYYTTEAAKDVFDLIAKSEEFKISLNEAGNTYKVSTNLVPGQTYYVYEKTLSGANTFAFYDTDPITVTLGVEKVLKLTLATDKAYFKGETISNGNIILVDNNSPEYLSANKAVKITKDDIAKIKFDSAPVYSISAAVAGAAEQPLSTPQELKYGKTKYTILSKNNVPKGPEGDHNKWTVTLTDGSFNTLSGDSVVTVDDSVKYYYGQTLADLANNAKTSGAKADDTVLGDNDVLTVEVSKTVSDGKLGTLLDDAALEKLDKGTKIYAKFWLQTISSDKIYDLTVQARPVMIKAEQNFFSKMGDAAISDNKIDTAQIREIDLFGTPYEKEANVEFINPEKTTADFTKVVTNDLKNAGKAQDYSLTVSAATAFSGAVVSKNIVISGANAEGFGYYVAPVFNIKFNGEFKSASFNNTQITPVSENVVDSKAVAELKKISADYKTKKVDDKVVFTADITLPTNVVLLNKASKFIGWKNEVTGETLDAGKEIKSVSENLRYSAVVKEAVPGFPENNALSIVLEDTVTYTGKKHVTDYEDQLGLGRGADNGAAVAFEKTKTTALANSGDVKLEVYVGDTPLIENYDYVATYKNNVNAYILSKHDKSEYAKKAPQVTIKFKNAYTAYPSVVKYFNIEPADITDGNYVQGCGVDSRVYKKLNEKNKNKALNKVFKTDLVNVYTGKKLNVNKDLDWVIEDSEQADLSKAGIKTVKISGKENSNYTGELTVNVLFVDGKVNWTTKNIGTRNVPAAVGKVTFSTGDSYWENMTAILDDIEANTAEGADITVTKQKGDYSTPGKKKLNYTAYVIDETAETPTYKAYKGTYSYEVGPVDPSKITILWNNQDAAASIEVPYAKAGATIDYQFSYGDGDGDLRNILKVSYKNNKKPGTAKAVVAAKNGAFFDKDGKKALKKAPFVKEFTIKQATLQDAAVVTKKYVVSSDAADSSKAAKNIKKTGSIVVVDSMGAPLKDGKDYTIGTVKNNEDGTYTVELNAKGNNYTGSLTIADAKGITAYLATATIKFGGKDFPKKIAEDDIEKLANGEITNKDFATKYNLTVNGKIAGKKAVFTQDDNFNFVVTKNHKGGKAFIQAVGLEGGIYGGTDVLAKSAINKGVE